MDKQQLMYIYVYISTYIHTHICDIHEIEETKQSLMDKQQLMYMYMYILHTHTDTLTQMHTDTYT